jgi:hypothetical protein
MKNLIYAKHTCTLAGLQILARVPEKSQALFFTFFRQHSPGPDRTGFF